MKQPYTISRLWRLYHFGFLGSSFLWQSPRAQSWMKTSFGKNLKRLISFEARPFRWGKDYLTHLHWIE